MTESTTPTSRAIPTGIQVLQDLMLLWFVGTLHAVAEYNFASIIGDGEMATQELAERTGALESWIFRTLRFLATHGYFHQVDAASRTFCNTERSACLRDDHPQSMRAMALLILDQRSLQEWSFFSETMRTGVPASELVLGMSSYKYFDLHPDKRALFENALVHLEATVDAAIVGAFDFARYEHIVDVGGGGGKLLAQIVERYHVRGTLFDRPEVIAQRKREAFPFELAAGDFFREIPAGDLYLIKSVLHNWTDEQCLDILRSCRRANAQGALLVSEQVIGSGRNYAETLDILMGLEYEGRERTQHEYAALFTQAGYRLSEVIPTPSPMTLLLVEAVT